MSTFAYPIEYPDIYEPVSFFAVQSQSDEAAWDWRYGLALRSTAQAEASGRAGDGDDFILAEGRLVVPETRANDVEDYLEEFAADNAPEMPTEVEDEFHLDYQLCEMAEISKRMPELGFEELYAEEAELDDMDEYDREQMEALRSYALGHGWEFD